MARRRRRGLLEDFIRAILAAALALLLLSAYLNSDLPETIGRGIADQMSLPGRASPTP